MTRTNFLILCGLALAVRLVAQPIAVETFAYPTGSPLVGQGAAADGWGGPWTLHGGDHPGNCTTDTLVVPSLLIRSALPVALLPSGAARTLRRPLAQPLPGAFWCAFLSRAEGNGFTKGTFGLVDTTAPETEQLRVEFGKTFASGALVSDGVFRYPRAAGASYPGGHWTVGRFVPESDSTTLLYLWTNPSPDASAPPDTTTAHTRRRFPTATFNAVQLSAQNRAGLNWWVDDLYIGGAFADVVPPDWTPATASSAPLPAREHFEYAPGELLLGQNGGTGFAGPWADRNNGAHLLTDTTIPFGDGQETVPAAAELLLGGSGTHNRYVRPLSTPYPDDGSTYWLGVVLNLTHTAQANVGQVYLARAAELGPNGPAGQLLQIGRAPEAPGFSVGAPPGDYTYLSGQPAAAPRWVVLKLSTSGDAAPDTVDVWFDPDPLASAPALADRMVRRLHVLNGGWDALGMKVEGQGTVSLLIDDLMLGNSFRDVVPPYLLTPTADLERLRVWTVFPNPGDGRVHFEQLPEGTTDLLVYDGQGRWLRTLAAQPSPRILPEAAPAGLYYLVLRGSTGRWLVRYVKR